MQLQEKQAKKYWKSIVIVQQKRMWCRKKKKGRKSAENFPLSWKKKNMEYMMMMWNLMLWNAPFSTKSPLAQVWILCCFSSCYCVGFLRIFSLVEQEQRMDGLNFFYILPIIFRSNMGISYMTKQKGNGGQVNQQKKTAKETTEKQTTKTSN